MDLFKYLNSPAGATAMGRLQMMEGRYGPMGGPAGGAAGALDRGPIADATRRHKYDTQDKFRAMQTMDTRSPWLQMMLQEEVPGPGGPGNPPPFVPVPVPVPTRKPGPASSTTADPEPGAASSESVDPEPSSDAEFIRRLMKPYNKGWRKGYED